MSSSKSQRADALHEAAHAVANLLLCPGRLADVTIAPDAARGTRGLTRCRGGQTYTGEAVARLVRIDLAGPAMEEIITRARHVDVSAYIRDGELPAGASSDLKNAAAKLASVPDAAQRALMLRGSYEAALAFLYDHEADVRRLSVELLKRRTMNAAECEAVLCSVHPRHAREGAG